MTEGTVPRPRAEAPEGEIVVTARTTGHRLFLDAVPRPVYEDERGQFIEEDGERIDGEWLVPEDQADTPVLVGKA
jgi:hypothetical protein